MILSTPLREEGHVASEGVSGLFAKEGDDLK